MEPASKQREFDFSARGTQLALLRDAVLPTHQGVSGRTLKAVIKAIDDFGRGRPAFAGRESLARSANIKKRQVTNAVNALIDLSLIVRERPHGKRGRPGLLRIVWTELAVLANYTQEPATRPERAALDHECAPRVNDHRLGAVPDLFGAVPDRLGAVRRPPDPLEAPETNLNRLLLQVPQAAHAEWEEGEVILRLFGIGTAGKVAAAVRERGLTAAAFKSAASEAIATVRLPANARRLSSPAGAVAHYLASGVWPVRGIIDGAEQQRRTAARAAAPPAPEQSAADLLCELEASHGAAFDALPEEERASIELEALGSAAWLKGRVSRRLAALRTLAKRFVTLLFSF